MGGGSAPAAPTYVAPPAYVQPPAYVAPQLQQINVPTAGQIMQTGNQIEGNGDSSTVPLNLQLNANNPDLPGGSAMNPAGMAQYEQQYYQQLGNPAVAQAEASIGANGQGYGSYGGALVAQTKASQDQAAYNAGLNYAQQNYNNILSGRSSYYAGGPTVATNQSNAQIQATESENANALAAAGMQNSYNVGTTGSQNAYNSSTASGLNNYNLSNYSNQEAAYQQQQQQAANTWLGIGTLGLGLLGMGGSGSSSSGTTSPLGSIGNYVQPAGNMSGTSGLNYLPSASGAFGSNSNYLSPSIY